MARKRHTPEEIVTKLRQVDVLTAQGKAVTDAIRPLNAITAAFSAADFFIDELVEPKPLPEMQEKYPDHYQRPMTLPIFIHFRLKPR